MHKQLNYMSHLVTSITNLSLDTAEEWQVGNYGIGTECFRLIPYPKLLSEKLELNFFNFL